MVDASKQAEMLGGRQVLLLCRCLALELAAGLVGDDAVRVAGLRYHPGEWAHWNGVECAPQTLSNRIRTLESRGLLESFRPGPKRSHIRLTAFGSRVADECLSFMLGKAWAELIDLAGLYRGQVPIEIGRKTVWMTRDEAAKLAPRLCGHCGSPLPVGKAKNARFCNPVCCRREWYKRKSEASAIAKLEGVA